MTEDERVEFAYLWFICDVKLALEADVPFTYVTDSPQLCKIFLTYCYNIAKSTINPVLNYIEEINPGDGVCYRVKRRNGLTITALCR